MTDTTVRAAGRSRDARLRDVPIVDCDVHPSADENLMPFLPERWRRHLEWVGLRNTFAPGAKSPQRRRAARLDASPPSGGNPGSDPEFAREQLLDEYGIAAAVLIPLEMWGGANVPAEFDIAVARATNDYLAESWLESDARWLASIQVPLETPDEAVREIIRCHDASDRYVQVNLNALTERPLGDPKYWPIYEAASESGLPVAVHVGLSSPYRPITGVGDEGSYYFESRGNVAGLGRVILSSMIFEGVLERFPKLNVLVVEHGWAWVVPFMWRLDSSWRVMRDEVPHLERKPSEYLRDQVYFSTQPAVEAETPTQVTQLYEQLERAGLAQRLLYSSDYPHWDMDSPYRGFPANLSQQFYEAIFSRTAIDLFGLSLEVDPR
jgi:predicted TIM-barrel fold metal-dependent hydrolase